MSGIFESLKSIVQIVWAIFEPISFIFNAITGAVKYFTDGFALVAKYMGAGYIPYQIFGVVVFLMSIAIVYKLAGREG